MKRHRNKGSKDIGGNGKRQKQEPLSLDSQYSALVKLYLSQEARRRGISISALPKSELDYYCANLKRNEFGILSIEVGIPPGASPVAILKLVQELCEKTGGAFIAPFDGPRRRWRTIDFKLNPKAEAKRQRELDAQKAETEPPTGQS